MAKKSKLPFTTSFILDYNDVEEGFVKEELSEIASNHELGQNNYIEIDEEIVYTFSETEKDSDGEPALIIDYPHLKALMDQHGIDSFILLYWW